MIACARLQKVFLCYYAAWYVPYHSDPFKNPFEDYMIDLIYPELDLPWCISLWSGVLLFILHQITFIFWYKDWGQESAFCTEESMFFELIFMVVVDRYLVLQSLSSLEKCCNAEFFSFENNISNSIDLVKIDLECTFQIRTNA